MVFPARTFAFVVLGSAGASAWGQVAPGAARAVPAAAATAPAPAPFTTAVAAFPDVVERHVQKRPALTHELLDTNPYDAELARLKAQENLFGPAIDEENPYAEQLMLANPYTAELRHRALEPDFENPYTPRPR